MDRRRALTAFVLSLAGLAAAPAAPPLRELTWTAPAGRATGPHVQPAECLALPADRVERDKVALGRALFRNPLLLGGRAARAGLSCASCHRNGRGNPDFLFPGLSGAPGTADVTSSLMSRTRGNGIVDPKPIPDLARDAPKIARAAGDPALEAFVRGLVVEEFDGVDPGPRAIAALAAYVRALRAEACGNDQPVPVNRASLAGEIMLDLGAVRMEARRAEPALLRLLLGGIRDTLGRIAARSTGDDEALRRFTRLDRNLARLQSRFSLGDLDRWEARAFAGDNRLDFPGLQTKARAFAIDPALR